MSVLLQPLTSIAVAAIGAPPPGPEMLFALALLLALFELVRAGVR